ncbi:septation protein SpoVG family protein [Rosistilla oblonga]|uniref:septation protein SpoVG family protein n=1 Tax=Rosistilla oblonga TaxID=2527990 RepID=UPI003A97762E
MDITEVRVKLMENSEDRLRAFCSITFDSCFVIRDLKIIDGTNGPFVAMPSRKLTGHCNRCGHKNYLRAPFCNQCGTKQRGGSGDNDGPQKLYADVAHPINSECREQIQRHVIEEFELELQRAQQPGYRSRYDDDFDSEDVAAAAAPQASELPAKLPPPAPHFHQRPSGEASSPRGGNDNDDSFGAGVF